MRKYAPPLRRFAAFLIDWYLSSLAGSIPVIVVHSILAGDLVISNQLDSLPLAAAWIAGILALFCHFLYYCYFPSREGKYWKQGQTIGLRLMRLQLLSVRETPVSLGILTLRHMFFVIVLQSYLTSSAVYLTTLFEMSTGVSIIAYAQTLSYILILFSLGYYFISRKRQCLQDRITGTRMYSEPD